MNLLKKIAPLIIVFAGAMAYSGSFSGTFIFDDYIWIVNNPGIRQLDSSILGSSRPLVGLTLHLNYLVSGLRAADYHLVNLLIHLVCALLIYRILRNTVENFNAGKDLRIEESLFPLAASLLWVVHPLTTESVTYIVQRSESLMAMFSLLTIYCFIRGVSAEGHAHRWFAAAISSCALGMACKPVMVTAPLVVLLYDGMFSDKPLVVIIRERRGLYLGLAATWLIPAALLAVPNESSTSAGFGAVTVSPMAYFLTQPGIILHYIRQVFVPTGLCIDYDWPAAEFSLETYVKVAIVATMVMVSLALYRCRKASGFIAVCFFILLFPSSGIIPLSDCAAEHRMYLPLLCVILLVLMGCEWFAVRMEQQLRPAGNIFPAALAVLLFVVAMVLGLATYERNRDYQDEEMMWNKVVLLRPLNLRGHLGLGSGLLRKNMDVGAEKCFSIIINDKRYMDEAFAFKYATELVMACNNLGIVRLRQGNYAEAINLFSRASRSGYLPEAARNLQLTRDLLDGQKK